VRTGTIFELFFTTKSTGTGVWATMSSDHRGPRRSSRASANKPYGAIFRVTLPSGNLWMQSLSAAARCPLWAQSGHPLATHPVRRNVEPERKASVNQAVPRNRAARKKAPHLRLCQRVNCGPKSQKSEQKFIQMRPGRV